MAVGKAAVVAMVVLDLHAMLSCKLFEGTFCIDGLFRGEVSHHDVDKLQAGVVVDEDGGVAESGFGECPLCLAIEAWLGGLHVVHRDALPRLDGNKDRMILVAMSFGAPRKICHGPKEAAGASRWANVGEACRNLTVEGKGLESREGFVPEAVVPMHQFSLVVGSGEGIFILLGKSRRRVKHQCLTMDGIRVSLVGRRR